MATKKANKLSTKQTKTTKTKAKKNLTTPKKQLPASTLLEQRTSKAATKGSRTNQSNSSSPATGNGPSSDPSVSPPPASYTSKKRKRVVESDEEEEEDGDENEEDENHPSKAVSGSRRLGAQRETSVNRTTSGQQDGASQSHSSSRNSDRYTAEDIEMLQDELYQQRRQNARLREQNAALKQGAPPTQKRTVQDTAPDKELGSDSDTATSQDAPLSSKVRAEALHLGKKFCATRAMWLPANIWDLVDGKSSELPQDEDDAETEGEQQAYEWAHFVVQELRDMVPRRLHGLFDNKHFGTRFALGMRDIRSNMVYRIPKQARRIFGIADEDFEDKELRRELPAVKALLQDNAFLYDPTLPVLESKGFMRHPCILKTLIMLLWGDTALATGGRRSTKTKPTNGYLWGLEEVSHALIAFGGTTVFFILRGESEFSEHTGSVDFRKFYIQQLNMLDTFASKKPNMYKKLMKYFNAGLFGDSSDDSAVVPAHEMAMSNGLAAFMTGDDDSDSDPDLDEAQEEHVGDKQGDMDGGEEELEDN